MKWKFINTKLHGILDYMSGLILLLPWITNFHQASADTLFLAAVGGVTIFMSVLTDYEFGLIKLLPMRVHLLLDICTAVLLILSPWLFSIYNYALYWPLLFGLFEMCVITFSSPVPYKVTQRDRDITRP